ncbi:MULTISPECIES: nucleotidyl transferase AbiEii/AbiGii toxin family protein [unclassified Aerococcus]|uniref:nucleotidyl transferase AbiEii/AbiGii toxin family protein n=1 Tax=unclassified Aerococcus TaxID=2618060 RepID=UPI0008A4262E|nr:MULTISPECIES: nucleotidyl transferase AbiEii/AbiGii toxin family protein [unclassified Aerococcus]MDK6679218.1 nucleotidyl transferase AbiEii/AbiGii toxin family protein [Aerococcus sp. UMB8608]MDK6685940.1 nucleotidyl transferase AbiEii/AbiGii toxin family protein [Aerococcus sp. UMB8623]MDK6939293.1 nucleotidyl transferase AbiEii/AbiGii toxin family protein [Aerococcus sp. UMB8487]OFK21281.1 hypothetical protein HMPREF2829_03825 [Aerococcus sp. HMSC072A12]OFR32563.1 hypothetical protein H
MESKKEIHSELIDSVLNYINSQSNQFILKGGTALFKCYGLNRFSEDIDLDALSNQNIIKLLETYCRKNRLPYSIQKNTSTVKRLSIKYVEVLTGQIPDDFQTTGLKIETSYRKKGLIPTEKICSVNGILTYKISELFKQKLEAYNSRNKIRDLYDICYIYKNYEKELTTDNKLSLIDAFSYKGLEEVDTLLLEQNDQLINKTKLEDEVLSLYDHLGLLEDNFEYTSLQDRLDEKINEQIHKQNTSTGRLFEDEREI